jgi:hypothetical protein
VRQPASQPAQPVPETNTIINHGGLDEAGAKEIVKRQDTQELETNAKIENSLTRARAASPSTMLLRSDGRKQNRQMPFNFSVFFFGFPFFVFCFPARTKFGTVTKLSFLFL